MHLSTQTFKTWTKSRGHHNAATFVFDSEGERDRFEAKLAKDKSVAFCRKKNLKTQYWITAHYNEGKEHRATL